MNSQAQQLLSPSPIFPGERHNKSALSRFTIDLSWARGASDSARSRAYPSPPMSGSPSQQPTARHRNTFEDRGNGVFGGQQQNVGYGTESSQGVMRESTRAGEVESYPQYSQHVPFSTYSIGRNTQVLDEPSSYQYQAQSQAQQQPQPETLQALPPPHQAYQFNVSQQLYQPPTRRPNTAPTRSEAPAPVVHKPQRKTKGHVASACVPCKRAHLRCDALRPCSRCVQGGKEDSCIDMVHKKRGRPRLRDDRENRFDPIYGQGPELMRRPLSLFSNEPMLHSDPLRSSYRILKSQTGNSASSSARFIDHAAASDANIYPRPSTRHGHTQELACMYLNTDFKIIKATRTLLDSVGVPSAVSRKLQDIVVPNDREKVQRLEREFADQQQKREPQYLPPIYGQTAQDAAIGSLAITHDEVNRVEMGRREVLIFQGQNGEQRSFEVRIGLGKKESTFFVALKLVIPPPQPPVPHQYSFPTLQREQQYGYTMFQNNYSGPQQNAFNYQAPMQPQMLPQPFSADDSRQDPGLMYRSHMSPLTNVQHQAILPPAMSNNMMAYGQSAYVSPPMPRVEFGQMQQQMTRTDLQSEQQQPLPNALQLPPIRTQDNSMMVPAMKANGMKDDRSSRLDIGGLLDDSNDPKTGM